MRIGATLRHPTLQGGTGAERRGIGHGMGGRDQRRMGGGVCGVITLCDDQCRACGPHRAGGPRHRNGGLAHGDDAIRCGERRVFQRALHGHVAAYGIYTSLPYCQKIGFHIVQPLRV